MTVNLQLDVLPRTLDKPSAKRDGVEEDIEAKSEKKTAWEVNSLHSINEKLIERDIFSCRYKSKLSRTKKPVNRLLQSHRTSEKSEVLVFSTCVEER
ncbi:hypothetical protein IRJ41_012758 [Triplophysa rosa]|uniref:Uncharacterized protein n=1 Tax=Triplophysa rosa TaxID=992332 RepID=A0A9W7WTF1_TRIRA|nr:hypothetical protein IRJ41_012758 [Triplophysa rosa]